MARDSYRSYFLIEFPSTKSAVTHTVSLFYNQVIHKAISEIDTNVYLGQLPKTNIQNHSKMTAVVSCNSYFELAGLATPPNCTVADITKWKNHFHLMFPDFTADTGIDLIIHTLDFMSKQQKNKNTLLIHCKAGRSRSALLAALLYIMNHPGDSINNTTSYSSEGLMHLLENAIAEIQEKRSQVSIGPEKKKLGVDVLQRCLEQKLFICVDDRWEINHDKLIELITPGKDEDYFSSELFLMEIVQDNAFKSLWLYGLKNLPQDSKRFFSLQTILQGLYNDPKKWHQLVGDKDLMTKKTDENSSDLERALFHFLNAHPHMIFFNNGKDNSHRKKLLNDLHEAMTRLKQNFELNNATRPEKPHTFKM